MANKTNEFSYQSLMVYLVQNLFCLNVILTIDHHIFFLIFHQEFIKLKYLMDAYHNHLPLFDLLNLVF